MNSIKVQGDIDVDDIPIFERPLIRDTMADNFVDRCTATLGEAMVVERARIRVAFDGGFVHNTINLIGRDSWTDMFGRNVQHFPSQTAHGSHFLDFRRV